MRVAWTIQLTGHPFDLEDQRHWTLGNPIHVAKADAERYDLVLPIAVVGENHEQVQTHAQKVLVALNGMGVLFEPAYGGVQLTNVMHTIDETGARRDAVVQVSGATMRIRGGRPTVLISGQPIADPTMGAAAAIMAASERATAVHDALLLLGRLAPTWSELFVAYELVKANVGGSIHDLGWASKAEVRIFKRTANSYTALGPQARHGKDEEPPPVSPMTHDQAHELVRRVVRSWVAFMADPHRARRS
jgi:hypothetical protein